MAIDPFRVLGLPAGASTAEVKRAYRRLAKANHPDSAGPAALPRFLEIQRAYETLTAPSWRPGQRRSPGSTTSPAWRAEPARTRATPGAKPPPGARATPGAKPPPGARAAPGATSAPGARPSGGRGGGRGAGRAGSGPADGAGASGGQRRTSRKATFGSTTYDEARDPSDERWSGASWYGTTSGEYWQVNPREYADPRKHGPEYQARAGSRASAGPSVAGESDPPRAGRSRPSPTGERRDPPRGRTSRHRDARQPRQPHASSDSAPPGAGSVGPADGPPRAPFGQSRGASTDASHLAVGPTFGISLSPATRRVVRALIAWPPLGIAAAAVIGEATGCAAFSATCTAPADIYPWAAQAVILAVLLALPRVSRVLAGGTIAVAILAFPVAAALSASGATYDPTYGPAALMSILAVAWLGGVAAVILRRAVARAVP